MEGKLNLQLNRDTAQDELIRKLHDAERQVVKERRTGQFVILSMAAILATAIFGIDARLESGADGQQWHIRTKEMPATLALMIAGGYLAGVAAVNLSDKQIKSLRDIVDAVRGIKEG